MRCPRCKGATMSRAPSTGAVAVERCARCGGTFLDFGELAAAAADPAILSGEPAKDVPVARDDEAGCPRCWIAMRKAEVPGQGFAVDRCGRCGGIFLDRGELAAIAAAQLVDGLEAIFRPAPAGNVVRPEGSGLTQEDRVVLARAADLARLHPEAAAFLRSKLA